jgi:uncharacterized membrane-anchored protein YhcB (DUF1043 family)
MMSVLVLDIVPDGALLSNVVALVIGLVIGYWVAYLQYTVRRLSQQTNNPQHDNKNGRDNDDGHQSHREED